MRGQKSGENSTKYLLITGPSTKDPFFLGWSLVPMSVPRSVNPLAYRHVFAQLDKGDLSTLNRQFRPTSDPDSVRCPTTLVLRANVLFLDKGIALGGL